MANTFPRPGAWAAFLQSANPGDVEDSFRATLFTGGTAVEEDLPFLLQGTSLGCLTEPPDGLGMVGLRTGDSSQVLRDGVKRGSDWCEGRTVTLTVEVTNDGCPGCPTAREKVRKIERVWGRYAGGLLGRLPRHTQLFTLILWPDCYDPALVGTDDQEWSGPYMLLGRPRGCAVTWHPSNQGRATLSLRFDAVDHRLMLTDFTESELGFPVFTPSHCVEVFGEGTQFSRQNLSTDPALVTAPFDSADAVVTEERNTAITAGPHGRGFFGFTVDTPATTSPFLMPMAGSGVSGIPVEPGELFTVSGYWWVSEAAGIQRFEVAWYDNAGALLSNALGDGFNVVPSRWERHWGAFEAPSGAAFATPAFSWVGGASYLLGFEGRNANALVEQDFNAATLAEVPAPHWYFDGYAYGFWSGTPNSSVSTTYITRRNQAFSARIQSLDPWLSSWAGGAVTESGVVGATDGPSLELINPVPGTPEFTNYARYTVTGTSASDLLLLNHSLDMRMGAYHDDPGGEDRAYLIIAVRTSATGLEFEAQTTGMNDAGALFTGGSIPAVTLTPDEWHVQHWVGASMGDVVALGSGANFTNAAALGVGDTVDIVASYAEAEEFYEQPTALREWFDQESNGAGPALPDHPFPEAASSEYFWQNADDPNNPQPIIIGGTECVFPLVRIRGPFTAPISIFFRDETSGASMVYTFNRDLEERDSLILDTRNKVLASFGGLDFNSELEFAGDIGPLGPGPVDVSVTFGTAGSEIGSVEVCWENHVTGA